MTTVYLSDNRIQVISGNGGSRPSVDRSAYTDEIGSCVFGGVITDKERFAQIVTRFFADNNFAKKDVVLVINSNQFITRVMKIPFKDEHGTLEYIANEFSDVERANTPLLAYSILSEDRQVRLRRVLAVMADRSFIENYLAIFASCGITVVSIQAAMCCAIRALRDFTQPELTGVFQIMEGTGFTNILFVKGVYTYSSFSRLFSEHKTADLGTEVSRSVSNLVQFAQSQQIAEEITNIYFAGFSPEDKAFSEDAIAGILPGMVISDLPEHQKIAVKAENMHFADCIFGIGAMMNREKPANFIYQLQRSGKPQSKSKVPTKLIAAGIILFVLLSALSGMMIYIRAVKQQQLNELNTYLNSSEVAAQKLYYQELSDVRAALQNELNGIQNVSEAIDSYPWPNSLVNQILEDCAEGLAIVNISQYDSHSGVLSFTTKAEEVDKINQFIEILKAREIFEVQNYSGYVYEPSSQLWTVSVEVCLSSGAGKGGVQ